MEGEHGERLREEAARRCSSRSGALVSTSTNTWLSAGQPSLQHVRLAKVFARMGYPGAARRQSDAVPVASARMQCRIDCAVTAGHQAIAKHDRQAAVKHLERIIDQLKRGIECGAIVDPWNILGFQANFSLFPAWKTRFATIGLTNWSRWWIGIIDLVFAAVE